MALGQRVVPMAPKGARAFAIRAASFSSARRTFSPRWYCARLAPQPPWRAWATLRKMSAKWRRPSRWRASAFAVACRSHTSASETSALPSEALFAARGALFEPILVTRAGEHARQIQRGGNKLESAFEEQA
jgi:hypothetical protein